MALMIVTAILSLFVRNGRSTSPFAMGETVSGFTRAPKGR